MEELGKSQQGGFWANCTLSKFLLESNFTCYWYDEEVNVWHAWAVTTSTTGHDVYVSTDESVDNVTRFGVATRLLSSCDVARSMFGQFYSSPRMFEIKL